MSDSKRYLGKFIIRNKQFEGEISHNFDTGVIVLQLSIPREESIGEIGSIDKIDGELWNGTYVSLFNNRCFLNNSGWFTTQHVGINSEYMILCKHKIDDKKYNRLVCYVENGVEWSGLSRINTKGFIELEEYKEYSVNYSDARVVFSTVVRGPKYVDSTKEVLRVKERLVFEIETDTKKPIEWFINFRNNILSIISFSIKDNVNIEEQVLLDNDDKVELGGRTECYTYALNTSERRLSTVGNYFFEHILKMEQVLTEDNLETIEKLSPVFDLYNSFYKYSHMPYEMVFLNIVQALETFHARFYYNDKIEEYKEEINKRFPDDEKNKEFRQKLLSEDQLNRNYITLASRLYDLIIGENDGIFYELYCEDRDYVNDFVVTRHYYTHYDKNKEERALKGNELKRAIRILQLVLEYRVCAFLGVKNDDKTRKQLIQIFDEGEDE